jgi:hypothetical protein
MRLRAAIGLSPIARISNADKKAARNKDIKGTTIISTHFGIRSMLMLRYRN